MQFRLPTDITTHSPAYIRDSSLVLVLILLLYVLHQEAGKGAGQAGEEGGLVTHMLLTPATRSVGV